MENLKKSFQDQVLENFKNEIFLGLKFLLVFVLLFSGFLFGRIYENSNNLSKNDFFTQIEISEISEKGIKGKVNFGSLKVFKDGEKFSFENGEFFIKK